MKVALAGLSLLVFGLAAAAPAIAGPESPRYVTSDPGDGAEVDSPPARVTVTFSEPLDESSSLHVYDECGQVVDAGDAQVLGSRMDVGVARTPSGHYTVVYDAKGFGGATGETKDDFSFHVTSGASCGAGSSHHDHEGHVGHEGHEGHSGHEGHLGHEGHSGHEGHVGHSGHEGHVGHEGHLGHAGHLGHTDHAGHAGHLGHAGHHHHGAGLAGVQPLGGDGGDGKGGNGGATLVSAPLGGDGGLAPSGRSVVTALALSIVMGAVGGWVLRVSAAS